MAAVDGISPAVKQALTLGKIAHPDENPTYDQVLRWLLEWDGDVPPVQYLKNEVGDFRL